MSRLNIQLEWLDPPDADEAVGPERLTWANLSMDVDGVSLTLNHPSDTPTRHERTFVVGGMSGIAEWIVENWLYILWEIHTPFPKLPSSGGEHERPRIPGLRDVMTGWGELTGLSGGTQNELARWQHRHSLGHASSSLALPSIVFVPEDRQIGLSVDYAPTHFNPSIRFASPLTGWPKEPFWLPKDEVDASLKELVQQTLQRARELGDDATIRWVDWLAKRWDYARSQALDETRRRVLMYGELVAGRWEILKKRLGKQARALGELLIDVEPIRDESLLDRLTKTFEGSSRRATPSKWGDIADEAGVGLLAPYQQGYQLANRAREYLGEHDKPLLDLGEVLMEFGVSLQAFEAGGLFRSAAITRSGNAASVLYDNKDSRFGSVNPSRFAIAVSFGRLLADAKVGTPFGAAFGSQARWIQSQRANAFAAELLLPKAALQKNADVETLCDEYGISRSAAKWHAHNRLGAQLASL